MLKFSTSPNIIAVGSTPCRGGRPEWPKGDVWRRRREDVAARRPRGFSRPGHGKWARVRTAADQRATASGRVIMTMERSPTLRAWPSYASTRPSKSSSAHFSGSLTIFLEVFIGSSSSAFIQIRARHRYIITALATSRVSRGGQTGSERKDCQPLRPVRFTAYSTLSLRPSTISVDVHELAVLQALRPVELAYQVGNIIHPPRTPRSAAVDPRGCPAHACLKRFAFLTDHRLSRNSRSEGSQLNPANQPARPGNHWMGSAHRAACARWRCRPRPALRHTVARSPPELAVPPEVKGEVRGGLMIQTPGGLSADDQAWQSPGHQAAIKSSITPGSRTPPEGTLVRGSLSQMHDQFHSI